MPVEPELIDRRLNSDARLRADDREALRQISRWMDNVFEIPGLGVRFGLDSLLGLLPGFGDAATSLVSLYILQAANRHNVSRVTLVRMGFNIGLDWLVGSLPFVGDLFDLYFKANLRNVALLEKHLDANPHAQQQARRGDWLFMTGLVIVLLLAFVGSVAITLFIAATVGVWLFGSAPLNDLS